VGFIYEKKLDTFYKHNAECPDLKEVLLSQMIASIIKITYNGIAGGSSEFMIKWGFRPYLSSFRKNGSLL
jgi:hypothetical protein